MTTSLDLHAINIYAAPQGVTVRRLAGDWMEDGYINNLGRASRLEVAVVDGRAYLPDMDGYLGNRYDGELTPIKLDAAGEIRIGCGWGFLPASGEMARIGLAG